MPEAEIGKPDMVTFCLNPGKFFQGEVLGITEAGTRVKIIKCSDSADHDYWQGKEMNVAVKRLIRASDEFKNG